MTSTHVCHILYPVFGMTSAPLFSRLMDRYTKCTKFLGSGTLEVEVAAVAMRGTEMNA